MVIVLLHLFLFIKIYGIHLGFVQLLIYFSSKINDIVSLT